MTDDGQIKSNQRVTLDDDLGFIGYAFAAYVDDDGQPTGEIAVSVSKPGNTNYHGCVRLPRERLVIL